MKCFVVAGFVLASVQALGAGDAGTEAAARRLLAEQARAVSTLDSFEVAHEVDVTSVTPKYRQTTHVYLKTWVERPGKVRVEKQQYQHGETLVSDGVSTWIYREGDTAAAKQAGAAPAALLSNAFPGLARGLSAARLPEVVTSARMDGEERLKVGEHEVLCDVVDVEVKPEAADGKLEGNRMRLWISHEYKVPMKVTASFVGATPADRKEYADIATDFSPGLRMPALTWVFTMPPK